MSLGALARAVLGRRFHEVARLYRAIFVNLDAVGETISAEIPANALVLDVGGGDGAPLDYLLARRPDIRVVMLDLANSIGGAVEEKFAAQVTRLPVTSLSDYTGEEPGAVLIMDVVHHVPLARRAAFFGELAAVVHKYEVPVVIIKDIQPGHIRAALSWLADRFISGDPNVRLISKQQLRDALAEYLGPFRVTETDLECKDPPNYCVVATSR